MYDLKEEPRQGPEKRTKALPCDYRSGIGWDVATLMILGSSLALASAAWFLVGLLMNEQQPTACRPAPNERPPSEVRSSADGLSQPHGGNGSNCYSHWTRQDASRSTRH
jgi:hypothetical protein